MNASPHPLELTRDALAEAVAHQLEDHRLDPTFHRRHDFPETTGCLEALPLAAAKLLELVDGGEVDL